MYTVICKQCQKEFLARHTNAKYCVTCQKNVKTAQDKDAWQRRKERRAVASQKKHIKLRKFDRHLQNELGIPPELFPKWKEENKKYYQNRCQAENEATIKAP